MTSTATTQATVTTACGHKVQGHLNSANLLSTTVLSDCCGAMLSAELDGLHCSKCRTLVADIEHQLVLGGHKGLDAAMEHLGCPCPWDCSVNTQHELLQALDPQA